MMQEFFINTKDVFSERFCLSKFVEYLTDNYDTLNSHVLNSLNKIQPQGFVTYIGAPYRADLLSEQIYADTQYWWVLLVYNGLMSSDDLLTGSSIKYPALTDLEDLYFTLKLRQGV